MLETIRQQQYLERINYSGSTDVSLATLNALHLAHMLAVPFENLDIATGVRVSENETAVLEKIIDRRRGGFCYELNHGFSLLLQSIGFKTEFLAARVYQGESLGPPFDHMLLSVVVDGQRYLADVGFGDSFRQVMTIADAPVEQSRAWYQIKVTEKNKLELWQKKKDWQPQYIFDLTAYAIEDFSEACVYHQTSEQSSFTRKSVCSIATPGGRKTLSNGRFIQNEAGEKKQSVIASAHEYHDILLQHFGVELAREANVERLLAHNY